MPSAVTSQAQLGNTLVAFSRDGLFPDDDATSSALVESSALPAALGALKAARKELENEVRHVSSTCDSTVDEWIASAQSIQLDANRTRSLANQIVRGAEYGEEGREIIREKEHHLEFLTREATFNAQLLEMLEDIQSANDLMNDMERVTDKNIIDALRIGDDAKRAIEALAVDKTTRAKGLLEARHEELRRCLHEILMNTWGALVHIDRDAGTVRIRRKLESIRDEVEKDAGDAGVDPEDLSTGKEMDLEQTITGLKYFGDLESLAERFWHELDDAVVKPRTDLHRNHLASIEVTDDCLWIGEAGADRQIRSLFRDLETIIKFLNARLPPAFAKAVSLVMMPPLSERIRDDWLNSCIPTSLDAMPEFQKALAQVMDFAHALDSLQWSGSRSYTEWVETASKNWLQKRREDALDLVRNQLSVGIGTTREVTHIERRMVSKNDGLNIGLENGDTAAVNQDDDWAAWDDDPPNEPSIDEKGESDHGLTTPRVDSTSKLSNDEERRMSYTSTAPVDEDTSAWDEDWGLEDDVTTEDNKSNPPQNDFAESSGKEAALDQKEITLAEKYTVSSVPLHVLNIITDVLEDAAKLSQEEFAHVPVAPAATGLFGFPNLILAMYRAVAPYYYTRDPCGNMHLYNDTIYIADQLKEFADHWNHRNELSPRIRKRLKLESELKSLETFGKRAYVEEMDSHKTIIKDLLGGAQNFLHSDDGGLPPDVFQGVEAVVSHIRNQAGLWKNLLAHSAWAQAIGSLASSVATKIIDDVGDLENLSVDGAEQTATLIAEITKLEDLFTDANSNTSVIGQYAADWLKLQVLSQILQSNLAETRYMWFESDLSEYFTAKQVENLIELSFAKNAVQKLLIKDILANPHPKAPPEYR